MTDNATIVKEVKQHLASLGKICDSGYLLAVHIRYTRPSLMFTTYPAAWLEQYGAAGMMMVDPVVRWAMSDQTTGGFARWSDLAADDAAGVVAGAAAHGLHNGLSFAIGPIASRTIGSVTATQPFDPVAITQAESLIQAIHDLTEGLDQMPAEVANALRNIG
jgi:LuxR family transcriptional regulator